MAHEIDRAMPKQLWRRVLVRLVIVVTPIGAMLFAGILFGDRAWISGIISIVVALIFFPLLVAVFQRKL